MLIFTEDVSLTKKVNSHTFFTLFRSQVYLNLTCAFPPWSMLMVNTSYFLLVTTILCRKISAPEDVFNP